MSRYNPSMLPAVSIQVGLTERKSRKSRETNGLYYDPHVNSPRNIYIDTTCGRKWYLQRGCNGRDRGCYDIPKLS